MTSSSGVSLFVLIVLSVSAAHAAGVAGDVTLTTVRGHHLSPEAGTAAPLHVGLEAPLFDEPSFRIAAKLDVLANAPFVLGDNSSALEFFWRPSSWSEEDHLSLALYPFSSRKVHLGLAYPVQWGRSTFLLNGGPQLLPAIRVDATWAGWSGFAALRTRVGISGTTDEEELWWMALASAERELPGGFRVGVQGEVGPSVGLRFEPENAMHWTQERGVTAFVTHETGGGVSEPVDAMYSSADPQFFERLAQRPTRISGFASSVSLEGTGQWAELVRAGRLESSATQAGSAAAIDARAQLQGTRGQLLLAYRTASFILADVPGFPPYVAFADDARPTPELSARLSVDHLFESIGLTPGIALMIELPASVRASALMTLTGDGGMVVPAGRTIVITAPNGLGVLADGRTAAPMFSAHATLRWDVRDVVTVLGALGYTRDPNAFEFSQDVTGVITEVAHPDAVSGAIAVQARF